MDPTKIPTQLKTMFSKQSYVLQQKTAKADSFVGSQEMPGHLYRPEHLPKPLVPPAKFAAMGVGPNPGSIQTPSPMNFSF
jgi:hypothetical protein